MRAARLVALAALLGAPALARADAEEGRFTLLVDGLIGTQSQSFSDQKAIHEFAEDGSLRTDYTLDSAPGFGATLQFDFSSSLGVAVGGSSVSRDLNARFDASLPHPLYLDRPRTAAGERSGTCKETAGHLSLVFHRRFGSLGLRLYAGVSYFDVSAELVDGVDYAHHYPYDEVTVSRVNAPSASGSGVGFGGGGGLEYRFSRHFGLGIEGRYSQATVEVGSNATKVDAGGFYGVGGIRLHF